MAQGDNIEQVGLTVDRVNSRGNGGVLFAGREDWCNYTTKGFVGEKAQPGDVVNVKLNEFNGRHWIMECHVTSRDASQTQTTPTPPFQGSNSQPFVRAAALNAAAILAAGQTGVTREQITDAADSFLAWLAA